MCARRTPSRHVGKLLPPLTRRRSFLRRTARSPTPSAPASCANLKVAAVQTEYDKCRQVACLISQQRFGAESADNN